MGPDELDDLLASIRAESEEESKEKGGALTLYEGTRETDLVSESIDERILRLLGLEEVFDMDYATYLSLLKEKLVAARMVNANLPGDENELLTDEFRRVKRKVGRFKIVRKKISSDDIGTTGKVIVSPDKFFLVSKAVIPSTSEGDGKESSSDIIKKLDELIDVIKNDNKLELKKQEDERKNKQNKKRQDAENRLESISKPVQRLLKTVVAPFQSILGRIFKFLKFTILGYAFNRFVTFFSNPKNQKKIEAIGRFLKDWWPSLLGVAALFFTPLGVLVKGVISLMRFAIPALLKIVKRNPYTALAIAGVSGIGLISKLLPKSEESTVESGDIKGIENFKDTGKLPDVVTKFNQGGIVNDQILKYNQGGMVPVMLTKGEYVVPPNQAQNIGASTLYAINNVKNYNQGGLIPGRGPNVDTVRTQLREGSFVIKRPAVDALGSNNIHNFVSNYNQGGIIGGLRFPRTGRVMTPPGSTGGRYVRDGGTVTNQIFKYNQGGMIGGLRLPRTGRVMAPLSSQGGTYDRDGGTVQKFLGMTVPGSFRRTGYTSEDIKRYNRVSPNNYLEQFEAGLKPETYSPDFYQYAAEMGIDTEGAHRVKPKPLSTSILNTGSNNTRLNKAIEDASQIGDMTGTQGLMRKASGTALQMQGRYDTLRDVMRQGGISGADETMNLYGKPMLGPQSRVSPVDMPQTMSKMQTIVLPPTTMQAKKPPNQGSAATELPSFNIARARSSNHVLEYLGIG
jgi:hypothetical protein